MGRRLRSACLALLLAGSIPAAAHAQGFHAVFSQDGVDAWAVGDNGLWYRTLDGGNAWGNGSLGPSALRDVAARGLTVIAVGDSGKIWRSTTSGGGWQLTVVAGTPDLRAVAMPVGSTAYVVGGGGTILRSDDDGATWTPQVSGVSVRLNAARFIDATEGWAVGEGGKALSTTDGGATWNPVALPTTRALYAVDQRGGRVWIVGAYGTAYASTNAGATFSPVDLALEAHSDVRAVSIQLPDSITLAGGGGFIRRSVDGGQTWSYLIHPQHGQISDVSFVGPNGFAVSNKNLSPIATSNRGVTWRLPTGSNMTRTWLLKQQFFGSTRGSSFGLNNVYPTTIYCALGSTLYRSRDEGDTWSIVSNTLPGTKVNAFIVSPKDTNVMVAAINGGSKQIVKSDDGGLTWVTVLTHDFGEYGIPLDYDHDHPDTMYFGGEADGFYRSTDAGKNWTRITENGFTFRSPCDIVVVPDSSNVILVGDGVTGSGQGQFFKSRDGGFKFTVQDTRPVGSSEIPGMSNSRLRPGVTFGTNWGSGGVERTQNFGDSWPNVMNTASAWGTDIAKDDPNVVMYGVYSGGLSYLSLDGGTTFAIQTPLAGSNYSFYLRDRGLILAEQSGGIYKMAFAYNYVPQNAQSLTLTSPNGGEVWGAGATHDITWDPTYVALARIEYRRDLASPWMWVADVPGYRGHYAWPVPNDATSQAKIRVRDAWDSSPTDSSNAAFAITAGTAGVGGTDASFALWQNQPNPFSRRTQIHYALPTETDVSLDVFDLQGQRVASLVHGRQSAGMHTVSFGRGATTASHGRLDRVTAGVYFYRMQAGAFTATKKMLVLE